MKNKWCFLTLANIVMIVALLGIIILASLTPPECRAGSGHNNRCHHLTK